MKIPAYSLLPVLAHSQDDTSTLLSLKVHSTLESGVDHLLDAVGSRNVTQMSSLLQNLVEETIGADAPYQLDGDVTAALEVIKSELLGDIRNALKESHCYDQSDLHNQIIASRDVKTGDGLVASLVERDAMAMLTRNAASISWVCTRSTLMHAALWMRGSSSSHRRSVPSRRKNAACCRTTLGTATPFVLAPLAMPVLMPLSVHGCRIRFQCSQPLTRPGQDFIQLVRLPTRTMLRRMPSVIASRLDVRLKTVHGTVAIT